MEISVIIDSKKIYETTITKKKVLKVTGKVALLTAVIGGIGTTSASALVRLPFDIPKEKIVDKGTMYLILRFVEMFFSDQVCKGFSAMEQLPVELIEKAIESKDAFKELMDYFRSIGL